MGRRLTAYKLNRRAAIATARETFLATPRTPSPYKQSGQMSELVYPSLSQGGVFWKVGVRVSSANMLVSGTPSATPLTSGIATTLGLLTTPPTDKVAIRVRGTGQKPVRIAWYTCGNLPVTKNTPWQTSSTSFAKKTGSGREEQSHRTCPIGDTTGTATYEGVLLTATALLTPDRKLQLIGNPRGGISLLPEIGELSLE